jgi:hypothetical protein
MVYYMPFTAPATGLPAAPVFNAGISDNQISPRSVQTALPDLAKSNPPLTGTGQRVLYP